MKAAFYAFFVLCASAAPSVAQTPALEPTPVAATSAAPVVTGAAAPNDYQLGPGDEIIVTVFNEPDLKTQQKIGAQGEISMPLVGVVKASGLTSGQLASQLESKFRGGYLLNPSVNVTVMTYRPFYVVGEVSRPGAYPFTPDLTVAGAIATAGGFGRDANRGDVFLRRVGETDEKKIRTREDIVLKPGDTLRIGRSAMAGIRDLPFGLLGLVP